MNDPFQKDLNDLYQSQSTIITEQSLQKNNMNSPFLSEQDKGEAFSNYYNATKDFGIIDTQIRQMEREQKMYQNDPFSNPFKLY